MCLYVCLCLSMLVLCLLLCVLCMWVDFPLTSLCVLLYASVRVSILSCTMIMHLVVCVYMSVNDFLIDSETGCCVSVFSYGVITEVVVCVVRMCGFPLLVLCLLS